MGSMEVHYIIFTSFICLKFPIIKRKKLWEIRLSSVLDVLFEKEIQSGSWIYEFGVHCWK